MLQVKAGIIDDGYPVMDEKRLVGDRISQLIQNEEWGTEESLRDLNISLTLESLKRKKKIQLEGFIHPEFFITTKQFDFDFLIYDWEYKPACEPHTQLFDIFKLTTSKIFVYSAYDKLDRIKETLDEPRFKPFKDDNRYDIRSKSNNADAKGIVAEIIEKFEAGEIFTWNQLELTIKPSKYIIDSEEFWLLRALIGSKNISNFLNEEKTSVIDENAIQEMFKKSAFKFFIDKHRSILAASNNQLVASKLGKLTELPIADAVDIFGIEKLEEAREKGYTTIK